MKKSLFLILFIVSLLLMIAAVKLPFLYGSSAEPVVVLLYIVGGIVFALAWFSALIRTAQLRRWSWFLFLLFLSVIALPIYLFWVPLPRSLPVSLLEKCKGAVLRAPGEQLCQREEQSWHALSRKKNMWGSAMPFSM
jgi:predicted membrane channel-forming protein YqfA (hemolysin III family)